VRDGLESADEVRVLDGGALPRADGSRDLVLLLGSATLGWAAVSFRLSHPQELLGFSEDVLQLSGELLAVSAAVVASLRTRRVRRYA
jgi:hypothetical protein